MRSRLPSLNIFILNPSPFPPIPIRFVLLNRQVIDVSVPLAVVCGYDKFYRLIAGSVRYISDCILCRILVPKIEGSLCLISDYQINTCHIAAVGRAAKRKVMRSVCKILRVRYGIIVRVKRYSAERRIDVARILTALLHVFALFHCCAALVAALVSTLVTTLVATLVSALVSALVATLIAALVAARYAASSDDQTIKKRIPCTVVGRHHKFHGLVSGSG